MKFFVGLAVLISVSALALAKDSACTVAKDASLVEPTEWVDLLTDSCYKETQNQIRSEIAASYTYLQIAAHFSRDTVNRPGFAEFFFKAAKEEREHAINLIEYLSMRGKLVSGFPELTYPGVLKPLPSFPTEKGGYKALSYALELEQIVTASIRNLISVCEKELKGPKRGNNDYHFVDYLTGVYLEEQHKGQREIAEKLSTLGKMQESHGNLAEFLFDKEL